MLLAQDQYIISPLMALPSLAPLCPSLNVPLSVPLYPSLYLAILSCVRTRPIRAEEWSGTQFLSIPLYLAILSCVRTRPIRAEEWSGTQFLSIPLSTSLFCLVSELDQSELRSGRGLSSSLSLSLPRYSVLCQN